MYGMSLWFRAYGIPFSALRVSLNFDALVGTKLSHQ